MSTSANQIADAVWTLVYGCAQLEVGSLRAEVRHAALDRGITTLQWRSKPVLDCRLLQLRCPACSPTPPPLVDSYVRGRDLVANYAEAARGAVQPHIYFRAGNSGDAAGLELIVSMQTSFLDSQPESLVTSELHASEVLILDSVLEQVAQPFDPAVQQATFSGAAGKAAYLFLFRLSDSLSYAEMVHPGDFVSAQLDASSTATRPGTLFKLTWRLFPEPLEKGVIRRCRIAGWFLPRDNDQQRSADLFRQFVEEPLPLTV
jgi:hypothetical protein